MKGEKIRVAFESALSEGLSTNMRGVRGQVYRALRRADKHSKHRATKRRRIA